MTKKLLIGLSAAALITAGASAALAASGGRHGDADGNGTVSRAEAQTHGAAMFAKLDVNQDGKLDAADRSAAAAERFTRLDTDKDGQLSREEFAAGRPDRSESGERHGRGERLGRHGGGHGGGRDGHGGPGGMMMLGMADADKDGTVTQAEFTTAQARHFDLVDTNKDGSISQEERKAARDKMRAMHGGPDAPPHGA